MEIPYLIFDFPFDFLPLFEVLAHVITAGSLILAYLTYLSGRHRYRTQSVIDQVAFFRSDILPAHERYGLRILNARLSLSRIILHTGSWSDLKIKSIALQQQIAAAELDFNQWLVESTAVLNMLEEFALRVENFRSIKHEALRAIRGTFVELTEKHALALLVQREHLSQKDVFESTLRLYRAWLPNIQRFEQPDLQGILNSLK